MWLLQDMPPKMFCCFVLVVNCPSLIGCSLRRMLQYESYVWISRVVLTRRRFEYFHGLASYNFNIDLFARAYIHCQARDVWMVTHAFDWWTSKGNVSQSSSWARSCRAQTLSRSHVCLNRKRNHARSYQQASLLGESLAALRKEHLRRQFKWMNLKEGCIEIIDRWRHANSELCRQIASLRSRN